jgi:hypothetical protein
VFAGNFYPNSNGDYSGGDNTMIDIPIVRSKMGVPCIWESGGGQTHTGSAVLVTNKHGKPKQALYVRTKGSLACLEHALIPVSIGDHVLIANHHRRDFTIEIFRISEITQFGAISERLNLYDWGQWDTELNPDFQDAVTIAIAKAICYHCREPHFIRADVKINA